MPNIKMHVPEKGFPQYSRGEYSKENAMINSIQNTDMVKVLDNSIQGKGKQTSIPPHEVRIPEDKVSLQEKLVDVISYGIPQKDTSMSSEQITLREMLVNILEGQGIATRIANGDTTIDFRELTPEKAQELISEDGYLGVEQTSDRIVQAAISFGGNDPSRVEEIKAVIEKGFQMAAEALGGVLPDISMETYDATMAKLDAWAESFDAA